MPFDFLTLLILIDAYSVIKQTNTFSDFFSDEQCVIAQPACTLNIFTFYHLAFWQILQNAMFFKEILDSCNPSAILQTVRGES